MTGVDGSVRALLERLDRLDRSEALALVRPPLPADATRLALRGAGLAAVPPALEWFGAWDGQSATGTLGSMDVLPGFHALSLQDALAHRAAQSTWPTAWLPVLADGGGDFDLVATADAAAPVLRDRYDHPDAPAVASSLATFLRIALRAFDEDVIFVQDGCLEHDDEAWLQLLGRGGR